MGKSTTVQKALKPYTQGVAGFVVQRVWQADEIVGYKANAVRGTLPGIDEAYAPGMEGLFLLRGKQNVQVLVNAINLAKQYCQEPPCKVVLLDEIGGLELLTPNFMEPLYAILNLCKPCVGVLKAEENLKHTCSRLGLGPEYLQAHHKLAQFIMQKGRLLTLAPQNRAMVEEQLALYLENAAGIK